MIYVPADPDIGFKNCCLRKGKFDGSLRDYYFQGVNNLKGAFPPGARPLLSASPAMRAGPAIEDFRLLKKAKSFI